VQFADAHTLVFKLQRATMPYEIFKMDLTDKKLVQLTHINRERLEPLDMHALEPFSFTGAKGDLVHGFLVKPPHFDPAKKYPAVELIHGGPQGEWGDDFGEIMGLVPCDNCGELVARAYIRLVGKRKMCIPCSGYGR